MSNVDTLLEELEATYEELRQTQIQYELLKVDVLWHCVCSFLGGAAVASGLWMLLTK